MKIKVRSISTGAIFTFVIFHLLSQSLIGIQAQDSREQELRKQMENLESILQPSARQKVTKAVRTLEHDIVSSAIKGDWYTATASIVRSQNNGLSSPDIDALVAMVLCELSNSEEADLSEMIDEMHKMNQQKEQQRKFIESMKKQMAAIRDKLRESYDKLKQEPIIIETGKTRLLGLKYTKTPKAPIEKDTRQMSAIELDQEIRNAEESMVSLGDISQRQQFELKDALEKKRQLIQAISNIMMTRRDSLKSIIKNMK
ncbi:MAG: hypothetical protein ABSB78_13415 [Bacteroidota bacterium]